MTSCSEMPITANVLEGMPGAGKTSVLAALALAGHAVLGEYTTDSARLVDLDCHPDYTDEAAHLANWLSKGAQAARLLGTVWIDRDWLTPLAWSASTSGLAERAAWVYRHLETGRLRLPQRWIILDVPSAVSLRRRTGRLEPGHPWADDAALRRLRAFYLDPVAALATAHLDLAMLAATIPRLTVDATTPFDELVAVVKEAGAQ